MPPRDRSGHANDDTAVAGIVAGLLMLGALVAFLAYFNATWVPAYVANKESSHASEIAAALQDLADATEDRIARDSPSRYTRAIPLGVPGIAVLGTGASAGELSVERGPRLDVRFDGTTVASAAGALAVTTHTTQWPGQTYRYALGALEVSQADGAWVDLRSFLVAERAPGGRLNVTLQAVDLAGAPQSAGGSGHAQASGAVSAVENATHDAGAWLRVNITDLPGTAGAWRVAIERTLGAESLSGETIPDCYATTKHYCFFAATNTASRVDLLLRDLAPGWRVTTGTVAADVRS